MKKTPQNILLALFVFAISSFAQTPPQSEEIWKEFSPPAGRFKLLGPGEPIETSQTIESRSGKIQQHTFTFMLGFATYFVSYSDFPITLTEPSDVKRFLDHMHEGEVASSQGKLLSITEIELDGYPGRVFVVETPNSMFRMKYFLVGQRFYQIATSTPTADFIARTWFPDFRKLADELEKQKQNDLAKSLRENAPTKNVAEIIQSLELFAAKFFGSFKLTGNTASPVKTPQDQRVKAVVVDEKGRPVTVKKIAPGSALKKVAPAYPPEAKAAGVSGKVEVQVTISEKGQVIEAIAVSGPELLREAAEQAAKQWVFKPAKADRKAVKVQGILTFNFTLQ